MLRNTAMRLFGLLLVVPALFMGGQVVAAPSELEAPVANAELPFQKFTLPNGLRVILHEDHRTPQVATNIWYRAGFADDPPGKRGLAHLFEHLMLRGSKHVGRDKFFSTLESAGASDRNATTSFDRTNYFMTLPSNQLALALWLESDRMGYFLDMLDQSVLDKEKEVVRNEHRSTTLDAPFAFVQRFARNAIYPADHPYHWRIEGEMDDLASITLDDLRGFFRRYYVPSNATLSIAGDIDPVRARELVTKYFGSFPRVPDPRTTPSLPETIRSEVRIRAETNVEAPRIMIGWSGPPRYTEGDVQLGLVADVLARTQGGRLHQALVRGAELATSVRALPDLMGERNARIFWLIAELKKGVDPERALDVVDRVIDDLRLHGPTDEEVAQARARRQRDLLWSLESVTRRADQLDALDWFGGDPSAFADVQRWAGASTAASLQDAVRRWLPKDRRAVVLAKHAAEAPVSGRVVTP